MPQLLENWDLHPIEMNWVQILNCADHAASAIG